MATDTRRRVKLYALNAERQWDDRGTGHVASNYVDRLKGISLLVRAEVDGSLLLESKIQPDTAYQKQQDTLIVWSEGDNFDLALSFQEKAGCDEIWEKICQVQGKDPSVEITQEIVEESEDERFEDMSDTAPPVELPPCEPGRLDDISEAIQSCLSTPMRKEKLAAALESESYIKKLLQVFHACEEAENTDGLHHLFDIFKNIFLLNKNALFEVMFADENIFDVVGCLEYDPNVPQRKKHREYLKNSAKFREAIPIRNKDLLAKIHQTFRVQYIQDIILPTPSVFVEDNMLNTLSSFIFFNKVEIVTSIQEDEQFLLELFALLTNETTDITKRRDIVLFLKEFCNYAQNLQPQAKDTFYKTLTCLGILQALQITLLVDDNVTKVASIDILTAIVEFSPLVMRTYTITQVNQADGNRLLMNIAIEQMLNDSEPELGIAIQLMGIIKILLEPENMLTEKADFLNLFYKNCVQTLVDPLIRNTSDECPLREDYTTAQLLGIILDILSFCVEHHSYHIKNYILQKDLLKRIMALMRSTHTFLTLGALRLMRKIVALKDDFYYRHIVKNNLLQPIVDAFIRNNSRYNLLESAILEFFEYIKTEDIRSLCVYFVEKFGSTLERVDYVQVFKSLQSKYDGKNPAGVDDKTNRLIDNNIPPMLRNDRFRRDQRQMDEEEEMWFNEDEDFPEDVAAYSSSLKVDDKNRTDMPSADEDPMLDFVAQPANTQDEENVPKSDTSELNNASELNSESSSPVSSLHIAAEANGVAKSTNFDDELNRPEEDQSAEAIAQLAVIAKIASEQEQEQDEEMQSIAATHEVVVKESQAENLDAQSELNGANHISEIHHAQLSPLDAAETASHFAETEPELMERDGDFDGLSRAPNSSLSLQKEIRSESADSSVQSPPAAKAQHETSELNVAAAVPVSSSSNEPSAANITSTISDATDTDAHNADDTNSCSSTVSSTDSVLDPAPAISSPEQQPSSNTDSDVQPSADSTSSTSPNTNESNGDTSSGANDSNVNDVTSASVHIVGKSLKKGLVDYGSDSGEDDFEDGEMQTYSPKKPRMA